MQRHRLALKTIRCLDMSKTQTSKHSEEWHRWCRLRSALDEALTCAVERISAVLPQEEDVQLGWLAAVMKIPKPSWGEAPLDTLSESMGAVASDMNAPSLGAARFAQQDSMRTISSKLTNFSHEDDDHSDPGTSESDFDSPTTHQFVYEAIAAAAVPGDAKKAPESLHLGSPHAAQPQLIPTPHHVESRKRNREHPEASISEGSRAFGRSDDEATKELQKLLLRDSEGPGAPATAQHSVHQGSSLPPSRGLLDVPQHRAVGTEEPRMLLGESGSVIAAVEELLRQLLACSHSDLLLIQQGTQFMCALTPV